MDGSRSLRQASGACEAAIPLSEHTDMVSRDDERTSQNPTASMSGGGPSLQSILKQLEGAELALCQATKSAIQGDNLMECCTEVTIAL